MTDTLPSPIRFLCGPMITGVLTLSGCAVLPESPPNSVETSIARNVLETSTSEQTVTTSDFLNRDGSAIESSAEQPSVSNEGRDLERTKVKRQFPPLIYGAQKPLVCSKEILATGLLKKRPNLQVMWENYLYESPKGVWAEVGGAVELNGCLPEDEGGWRNACTVRLSHMLNKAGQTIPYIKEQTVSGKDGGQYFFRLNDAQAYLEKTFGTPDLDVDDASGRWIDIPNEPGLLIMKYPGSGFTGHATIWNGAGTVDGVDVVGFRILYWKLPCFTPPDRRAFQN